MEVAVEQLMNALTCQTVPAEIYIGMDAKFFFTFLRMLPHWVFDVVGRRLEPQPVPACLRK